MTKELFAKIFAIVVFAILLFLSGYIMVWLGACFAYLEWLQFLPIGASDGNHFAVRIILTFWLLGCFIFASRITK